MRKLASTDVLVADLRRRLRDGSIFVYMNDKVVPGGVPESTAASTYSDGMAASAAEIAATLRSRVPNLPTKKLHKLLYYCQGHHLATFGQPLFPEAVSAFDMGPVVGSLWHREKETGERTTVAGLTEAELNTVGYVVSRYGALSGRDLEILTHHEDPWMRANESREPGGRVRIEREWMQEYFAADAVGDELPDPPAELLRRWHQAIEASADTEVAPDSVARLRERLGRSA